MDTIGIISAVMILGFAVYCGISLWFNRDAKPRLHPDPNDPHKWSDNEGTVM